MKKDVAILGAGPAGLSAARAMARNGFKVLVIEQRKDVTEIPLYRADNVVPSLFGERVEITQEKIRFPESDFELSKKEALTVKRFGMAMFSPNMSCLSLRTKEPSSYAVDFRKWEEKLYQKTLDAGAEILNGTKGLSLERNNRNFTKLHCVRNEHEKFEVEARFFVGADGAGSKIVEMAGFRRLKLGELWALGYRLKDIDESSFSGKVHPDMMNIFFGDRFTLPGMDIGVIAPLSKNRFHFAVTTSVPKNQRKFRLKEGMEHFLKFLKLSKETKEAFKNTVPEVSTGCHVSIMSPLKRPYRDNFIALGDAAYSIELEFQGATLSGKKGSDAVAGYLEGKDEPFENYQNWWNKVLREGKNQMKIYRFIQTASDSDLNRIFSMLGEDIQLEYAHPYGYGREMNNAILKSILTHPFSFLGGIPTILKVLIKMNSLKN